MTHSVLNVALDSRPTEGIPNPEPLEHSVLVMALDGGLTEGMSHLELIEHSVLNVALVTRPVEGTPDMVPLEHSVLAMTLDDEPLDKVLDMALNNGLAQGSGEPMCGLDCGLAFTDIPVTMRNVDLGLGAAVPFPADDVGRVTLPPAEARQ